MNKNIRQRGAVSLFVVIFSALLITVVTVSFIRIMIHNQQQATAIDLSQSAFDSAQAGVEDAKRALLRYSSICDTGGDCTGTKDIINSLTCNTAVRTLTDVEQFGPEIPVQTSDDDGALNQAYTCVKIITDTIDVQGFLREDKSKFIPLKAVGPFNKVKIEWFVKNDINLSNQNDVFLLNSGTPLLSTESWKLNTPAVMRTQLIQFSNERFFLDSFNDTDISGQSNTNTIFLYPSSVGISDIGLFSAKDIRRGVNPSPPGSPVAIECSPTLDTGSYACSTSLTLPTPIGGGDRTAFLHLKALYNGAHYRVTLLNNSTSVLFNGVQPSVDSTGRANDLFRRVHARVELNDSNFPYPEAEIDMTGNLCKDFFVTDSSALDGGYNPGTCTP